MKPTQLTRPELVTDAHRALHALIWNGRQRFQAIVKDFGLTGPQASFLMHVHKRGPVCSMGEVTDALQLIASTSTSVADRLVERGLIERGINPGDRRVVEVSLTANGVRLVSEIEDERARSFASLLEDFSDEDIARFRELLDRIVAAMLQS